MKKKILYFVHGGLPDKRQEAEIAKLGALVRNASAYSSTDFIEQCDAVAGDAPDAYRAQFPMAGEKPVKQEAPVDQTPAQAATASASRGRPKAT